MAPSPGRFPSGFKRRRLRNWNQAGFSSRRIRTLPNRAFSNRTIDSALDAVDGQTRGPALAIASGDPSRYCSKLEVKSPASFAAV